MPTRPCLLRMPVSQKLMKYTPAEWNQLMWAKSHIEVERILKEAYTRRVDEGHPREGFDRLREVEAAIEDNR